METQMHTIHETCSWKKQEENQYPVKKKIHSPSPNLIPQQKAIKHLWEDVNSCWSGLRGVETWGFHESPSYPHMYCFLAWRERLESSAEKTLSWNTIVIGDFLNLGSVSHV